MSQQTAEKIINPSPQEPAVQPPAVVERMPMRMQTAVESPIPVLDTAMFDHMTRIAKLMASSSLVPAHLNSERKVGGQLIAIEPGEAIANCFLIVNQAVRWRMDPFAVAQHVFVHKGKIGYEGKLVAAVINTHPALVKRLSYRFDGPVGKPDRRVIVTGRTSSDDEDRTIEGTVAQWRTDNENWTKSPDQMLTYRGAREWARRWMPEAILGVYADDELEQFNATDRQVQTDHPTRGAAGLKAALVGKDAAAQAGLEAASGDIEARVRDADSSKGTQPASAAADPKAKPAGTLEQRDAYIRKFSVCKDAEILALVRDEANMFSFGDADQRAIDDAYHARMKELQT